MILGPRHVPVWTKTNIPLQWLRCSRVVAGVPVGNGCWSMTAFARSLLREVFYGMQWGSPSASTAEETAS